MGVFSLTIGIFCLISIEVTAGLQCFHCERCEQPESLQNCTKVWSGNMENFVCAKTVADGLVSRYCYPGSITDFDNSKECPGRNGITTCYCDTDKCNGVQSLIKSSISSVFMTLVIGLITFNYIMFGL